MTELTAVDDLPDPNDILREAAARLQSDDDASPFLLAVAEVFVTVADEGFPVHDFDEDDYLTATLQLAKVSMSTDV